MTDPEEPEGLPAHDGVGEEIDDAHEGVQAQARGACHALRCGGGIRKTLDYLFGGSQESVTLQQVCNIME